MKISIVSGGFDPLHIGHVELLNKAKSLEKLGKLKNLTKEQKLEMNKFLPKLKEYKKKLFKQAKKHKETLKEKSPWRISKFKGGLIDKPLTGRSRDI